jgi:ABC-type glutathione transport system ATPase component
MKNDPVLELRSVSVTFRQGIGRRGREIRAMDGVSFSIGEGETLGLVGESGSGKSTTGAVALGLRAPDAGEVAFQGQPMARSLRSRAGRVQAVLQHPQWSLDPRSKVGHSIAEPLRAARGGGYADHRDRVLAMLEEVRMDPALAERFPHELSGGQRQRISIARALVTEPSFIVFDEAVSALDVSVQSQILRLIARLQEEHRFAALFISHDLGAVRAISHRVAVMRGGEVVELAPTQTFYEVPAHPYSRQLLEAM